MTNSYFHIVEDNIVILSNLPKELLTEFDTCEAETKCLICPIKNITKRQKRIKSSSGKGYIYFCTYETDMTKKHSHTILMHFVVCMKPFVIKL